MPQSSEKNLLSVLVLVAVLMFGFAFALVPIYNSVCKWLGINGQAVQTDQQAIAKFEVDKSRQVQVEFYSDVNSNLDWEFHAKTSKIKVYPGKQMRINYVVRNRSNSESTGLAKFNIHPPEAGRYFKKTECFCFTQQTLAKHETRQMPLVFLVDPKLPKRIDNIVLTYEFIGAKKATQKKLVTGLSR